jgi:hypothetical protein
LSITRAPASPSQNTAERPRARNLRVSNQYGETVGPLHIIAKYRTDAEIAFTRYFLETGEDINALCGPEGTALHAAIWSFSDNTDLILFLLAEGANVNADGPEGKPFDEALKMDESFHWSHTDRRVKILIHHGAISDYIPHDEMIRTLELCGDDLKLFWRLMWEARKGFEGFEIRTIRVFQNREYYRG